MKDLSGLPYRKGNMKKLFLVFLALILIPLSMQQGFSLKEIAGSIVVHVMPGETKTFQWGLLSDSDNVTSVGISAQGNGSQFLSFPKSFDIQPRQLAYVNVSVSIPNDYPIGVTLSPSLSATQFGKAGGPTIINIQVIKDVSIVVGPTLNATQQKSPSVPEFPASAAILIVATIILVVTSRIWWNR